MKKIVIMLLAVFLVACEDRNGVSNIELDSEFTLNEGDSAINSDAGIRLDVSNLSDSRCPEGANCIWEGEAKVLFSFEIAEGQIYQDSLSTFNRSQVFIEEFSIELLDVSPYPEWNKTAENKSIRLIISRD